MNLPRTAGRVLTFRASRDELLALGPRQALFGLALAAVAGAGRHWDAEGLSWVRHTGIGSAAYTLALAAAIWVALAPLRPAALGFTRIVAFVGLTAPPGLLYAVPIERFLDPRAAADVNVAFLLVVAVWRVALFGWFLRKLSRLPVLPLMFGAGLPVLGLLGLLGLTNLTGVVAQSMGGWREVSPATRAAEETAVLLGAGAILLFLPWLICWGIAVGVRSALKSVPSIDPADPPRDPVPGR